MFSLTGVRHRYGAREVLRLQHLVDGVLQFTRGPRPDSPRVRLDVSREADLAEEVGQGLAGGLAGGAFLLLEGGQIDGGEGLTERALRLEANAGIEVHSTSRRCSYNSAPPTAAARLAVSDNGEDLSPK